MVPVQQQVGNSICGVMAIANGYHAVCGDDLATLTFHQEEMRNHLLTCIENERFTAFPLCQHPGEERSVSFVNIEMNCYCGRPHSWQDMIGCDGCNKWFHLDCSGIVHSIPDGDWFCSKCFTDYCTCTATYDTMQ